MKSLMQKLEEIISAPMTELHRIQGGNQTQKYLDHKRSMKILQETDLNGGLSLRITVDRLESTRMHESYSDTIIPSAIAQIEGKFHQAYARTPNTYSIEIVLGDLKFAIPKEYWSHFTAAERKKAAARKTQFLEVQKNPQQNTYNSLEAKIENIPTPEHITKEKQEQYKICENPAQNIASENNASEDAKEKAYINPETAADEISSPAPRMSAKEIIQQLKPWYPKRAYKKNPNEQRWKKTNPSGHADARKHVREALDNQAELSDETQNEYRVYLNNLRDDRIEIKHIGTIDKAISLAEEEYSKQYPESKMKYSTIEVHKNIKGNIEIVHSSYVIPHTKIYLFK